MIRKIKNDINHMSFSIKLTIISVVSVVLAIIIASCIQTVLFTRSSKSNNQIVLEKITEQAASQYTQTLDSIYSNIFTRLRTFGIPELMKDAENREELQYQIYHTVSISTKCDFVMIELIDGTKINTDSSTLIDGEKLSVIAKESGEYIDLFEEKLPESAVWFRSSSGELYFAGSVYDTDPLCYVGKMVAHVKTEALGIAEVYPNMTFLFFSHDGVLTAVGGDMTNGALIEKSDEIFRSVKDKENPELRDIGYLSAEAKSNQWVTIGLYSTAEIQRQIKTIIIETTVCALLGVVLGILAQQVLTQSIVNRLDELKASMDLVAQGNLEYRAPVRGSDDISQLAVTFNNMTERINDLLRQLISKEKDEQNARYEMMEYKYRSMETQIKSHFIYNALEKINALAKLDNNERIVETTQLVSRYFRSIAENSSSQFISVEQEFESLKGYTKIFDITHDITLTTEFVLDDDVRKALIPTMILQPIVENSLKHRKRNCTEQYVGIRAERQGDSLLLNVSDDGEGLTDEAIRAFYNGTQKSDASSTRIGLANVKNRLELLFDRKAFIDIRNSEKGGAEVTIHLPFNYVQMSFDDMDVLSELDTI